MLPDRRGFLIAAALLAVGAGGVTAAVRWSQALPDGPQPIVWDQEACAHCRMLIGAPGFAAQLQGQDGAVLDFDDPGCLLRYLDERKPRVHALWFHHSAQDRWLRGDEVAFRRVAETPMGWGLAAVAVDEPHDYTREQAQRAIAAMHDRSALASGESPP